MSGCHNPNDNDLYGRMKKIESDYMDKAIDLQAIRNNIAAIFDRLEMLEANEKGHNKWAQKYVDQFNERLETLQEMQINMISMPNVIWAKYNKTPYKCPVCEGLRGTIISGVIDEFCMPCKGMGIVWG